MKNCNLVWDLNYLFHSEFSVFSGYNKSPRFSGERDEISFVQGVANKLFFALGHLPKSGKVVFCVDSNSWRKSVEIPGGGYKASRDNEKGGKGQMDKETMERFYALVDEFSKRLASVGMVVSKISGAEGDDLIYRWCDHFKRIGENVMVISADKDLTQLVHMGEHGEPWTICWNNKTKDNKFYVPAAWQREWLSGESDVFNFNVMDDRSIIKSHIRNFAIDLNVVDPHTVALQKILLGKDKDDVPPAWSYLGKTRDGKDKMINLTPTVMASVVAAVKDKYGIFADGILDRFDDDEFLMDFAGMILRVMQDVDGVEERKAVVVSLRRNRTLSHLCDSSLPPNLLSHIDEHISESLDELRIHRDKWNKKALFEGTRFSDAAPPRRDDPFAFMQLPD